MAAPTAPEARSAPGSATARWAFRLGLLAPLIAVAGTFAASRELLSPFLGFRIFGLALPLAVVGLVLGWFALLRSRKGRNPQGRRRALVGSVLSVLTLSAVVGLALPSAPFPLINDITTDLADPPQFVKCTELVPNRGRDMSYPPAFAEQQKAGYPALAGRVLPIEPVFAVERVVAALESLPGTTIVDVDAEAGRVEAISTTRVFRFVDDIVVRVRAEGSESRIDMRSKSRDGKGDLGANAARIEGFMLALR
jgi:uncharacterized protein (DUF1499 family)